MVGFCSTPPTDEAVNMGMEPRRFGGGVDPLMVQRDEDWDGPAWASTASLTVRSDILGCLEKVGEKQTFLCHMTDRC